MKNIDKLLIFFKRKNLFYIKLKENKLVVYILAIFSVSGLFIINLLINWPIRLKALAFSDDLNSWDFFYINRNNFFGYILNTGANKFRPIFNFIFFGLFKFFGNNIWLFGIYNIMFSFLIAVVLFFLFRKISKNIIVSFCLSVAFILSRFAYFDITQAFGVMESLALLLSVFVIYLLWCYLNTEKIKYFWISLIIFLLLIFTHERFVVLLGIYFVVFLILGLKRNNILLFTLSVLPVILNFVLKIFVLQIRPLDGTGATNILQTFNIAGFFQNFLSAWFYLFGVNAGPTYLNGIPSAGVPQNINNLILVGNISLLLIFTFFWLLLKKSKKILFRNYIKNFLLFFSFIFLTLIAASVTIRVEMRWLYVPFVGLLFLLAYVFGITKQIVLSKVCLILLILWLVTFVPREMFYRSYYKNLYYWNVQTFGNNLYENTLGKYGDHFWNYKIYIVCPQENLSNLNGFTNINEINLFFCQFGKEGNNPNLFLVDKVSKILPIKNDNKLLILNCN